MYIVYIEKRVTDMVMENGVIAMIAICVFILMIGILKEKARIMFQFMTRGIIGLICIYFSNEFLKMQDISVSVGLNPISFLTVGTLGISGFALLYGILFFKTL